jgi:small subunit ribosomal protein S20
MANSKSARKRAEKSALQREKNRAARSKMRTLVKKARAAVAAGDAGSASVATAVSGLDAAASKGLIHKNTAARTKSRLAKAAAKSAKK